ncbi:MULTISPECIES: GGDEF domain-containing protein [Vibrio]|uniref:diguanylate cyclase n=1 Tax=Vibrio algicola TaxID=2662262 RepID=A0A5Q0TD26_9VIBR|nr:MULTISPECIES: GGDEF domain-containing protein [Vibrio]MBD1574972.1 GGDEF domain-containing protein [Vibrio sp. S11_S32]
MHRQRKEKDHLRKEISIDPMTGLFNRRVLDNQMMEVISHSRIKEKQIALISIDANKFKQINDNYGHLVGDQAILHIAKSMLLCSGENDFSIRMGGDEFLLVMPDSSATLAQQMTERLERHVLETSTKDIGIEVSISAAYTMLENSESFDQAYRRVDSVLYTKKGLTI